MTRPVLQGTRIIAGALALLCALPAGGARAQIAPEAERNVSRMANYQNECSIAVDPTDKTRLFAACNNSTGGIFFARSTDRGDTWLYPDADKTIADGDAGQGNLACCDPTLAWDRFGNLYVTYLGAAGAIETLLSTDGGQTFSILATFAGSNDQPTIAVADIGGGQSAVWIVWNQSLSATNSPMRASGAIATGLGAVGPFGAAQTIPGTNNCSFGDVAISPTGVVVQACETPTGGQGPANILVNIDADGVGAGNFGAAIVATATNVGGFDFIPAQNVRSVDAEAGLAFDRNPASPRFGRLYLVYADEAVNENNDTNILVRFSDNNGAAWSAPVQVNDDAGARSQFLPRISSNPLSGNIAVCWHDARNSAGNNTAQTFCSLATPTPATPAFFANAQVSAGTSTGTGSNPPVAGQLDIQYGDYSGLDYFQGRFHPIWADQSNSTGDNPDGTARWEAHSNRVGGGSAANEGDPHLRTVDGVSYDFQGAGEYVSLRSAGGFELQTRMAAVATDFFPGTNPHTGLQTCASVNTAMAARVAGRRISYQPKPGSGREPSDLELRIDGALTALPASGAGYALGSGARVVRTAVGGVEIEDGAGGRITATPGYWASQNVWYMNISVTGVDALEGVMGALSRGGWLPALPDGSSMGPRPAATAQRYDDLYLKFGGAWRVTPASSLFDYAAGESPATFARAGWPKTAPPCDLPNVVSAKPASPAVAARACRPIADKRRRANCEFDVRATGETGFARTYALSERLERQGTTTDVFVEAPRQGETAFIARVKPRWPDQRVAPTGTVQFYLHDEPLGDPVALDKSGRARFAPAGFNRRQYRVSARFVPARGSPYLESTSAEAASPDTSAIDVYQPK